MLRGRPQAPLDLGWLRLVNRDCRGVSDSFLELLRDADDPYCVEFGERVIEMREFTSGGRAKSQNQLRPFIRSFVCRVGGSNQDRSLVKVTDPLLLAVKLSGVVDVGKCLP